MSSWAYIVASGRHGTVYLGATNNLLRRVWEHRTCVVEDCAGRYDLNQLVWFEEYPEAIEALQRVHRIKHWRRDWKVALIEERNPHWDDLYSGVATWKRAGITPRSRLVRI